jgi:hypothetical protein
MERAMAEAKINQQVPPDLFIAGFNCFNVQARPGVEILMRIQIPDGPSIDITMDAATTETLEAVLKAARARALMAPLAAASVPSIVDKGQITDEATAFEDGGSIAEQAPAAAEVADTTKLN